METQKKNPVLDDVLNEFVAECERPTAKTLEAWVRRYPEFRRELVDFAAAWAEQLALPPAPGLSAEQEKNVADRAMSHMLNVVFERDQQAHDTREAGPPIASLTGEAKAAGYTPQEFAMECDLDLALLSKLTNRQIQPLSIPPRVISRLAAALRRPVAAIQAFLQGPPQIAAGMAFHSRSKPESGEQQSFADAVRASSLSAEEKARWLAEATGLKEER